MLVGYLGKISCIAFLGMGVLAFAPTVPAVAGGSYDYGEVQGPGPSDEYAEVYREPLDAGSVEHYERYGERSYDKSYDKDVYAPKYRGSTKDDYVGEPEPKYSYRERYEDYGYRQRRYNPYRDNSSRRCIGRRQIKRTLEANGWCDFAGYDSEDDLVYLRARRNARGPRYQLILDRCTGDVIRARPMARYGRYLREFR